MLDNNRIEDMINLTVRPRVTPEEIAERVTGPLTCWYFVGCDNSAMLAKNYGEILENANAFFAPFILEQCAVFAKAYGGIKRFTKKRKKAVPSAIEYLHILKEDDCDVSGAERFLATLPKDHDISVFRNCLRQYAEEIFPNGVINRFYAAVCDAEKIYAEYGEPCPCIHCGDRMSCATICY